MDGKRLIEKIRLRNILSFGDKGEEITLEPLNIIIGQNASGKSNFIDAIKLFRSLPETKGLANYISRSGGINEWIWKGNKTDNSAYFDIYLFYSDYIEYKGSFSEVGQRAKLGEEKLNTFNKTNKKNTPKSSFVSFLSEDSLLSREGIQDKNSLESIIIAGKALSSIVAYTDLQISRNSEIRKPQIPDAPNDFLSEDGSNLSLVLNDFEFRGNIKNKIIENLKKFYPRVNDYLVRILGGTVQFFFREHGFEVPISAMRLSDGTLRYLCLLAILCHPEPPPLICIEEPETGLHPDILPTIAELMIEASQRTQLIVTTHSDILVSAFSEVPEAVLVCEKDEDGTHFKRLEKDKLKAWLKEYELGDLWLRGEIGGKRW